MVLKKYKHITFPTNPTFVQTPESFVSSASGLVTRWEDQSGNNNHSLPIAGTLRTSNQNSLQGLLPLTSSVMRRAITINPQSGTSAILVQRNCDLKTIPGTNYLMYFSNLGTTITHAIYAVDSQYGINYSGSTITTGAYSGIGKYLFIIIRHNAGAVNYFINNTSTNSTIVKTSTPSYISEPYYFYDVNDTGSQAGYIQNFKAYWNRELTDAEVLQLSQYIFMMSNGAVGDNPNTLTKYQEITFPTGATYIHTPDSIATSTAGLVTSWKDVSGNNNHASTIAGSFRQSNQNSVAGLTASVSTAISKNITINPNTNTVAVLVQRNSNSSATITASNGHLYYITGEANVLLTAISTSNLTISYTGATATTIANPSANLGSFLFLIVRYNNGAANYYLNNTITNTSITKLSSPSFTNASYGFYSKISNVDSDKVIPCFSAYWNRELSNAECTVLSNYVYNITNGAVGDEPLNTALVSNLQSQLAVL